MPAIYDRVLSELGYDPNYKIGYTGSVNRTNIQAPKAQSGDFLGNIFNSIRSGVNAVPGVIGGVAKDTGNAINYSAKGIQQFLPNVLFGSQQSAKGGYVPGLANLVAPGLSPIFQRQAQANAEGKATVFDNLTGSQMSKIAQINDMVTKSGGKTTKKQSEFYQSELKKIGLDNVDPQQFAMALGQTAALPFAFGKLSGVGAAGSRLAAAEKILGASKEAQPFVDGIGGTLKTIAKAPLKQELINKPNVNAALSIPGQLQSGDVKGAAVNAGSFLVPAALALGGKVAKTTSNFIGKNIFDTSGVFDKILLKSGRSVNQELKAFGGEALKVGLDNPKLAKQATRMENRLRKLQDLLLQESNGNHSLAAQKLGEYQSEVNDFSKMDLETFVKEATRHFEAREASQKIAKAGSFGEKFVNKQGVTIGRLTKADKTTITTRLKQSEDLVKEVEKLKKEGVIKNENLYRQLQDLTKSGDKKYALDGVKQLTAADPLLLKSGEAKTFKNGYFATYSSTAGTVREAKETAKLVEGKSAKLGFVGEKLRKAGLSPEQVTAEDNRYAFNKMKNVFTAKIDGIASKTGNSLYKDLNELAENTIGITDIRQLSKTKIADELNITKKQAGEILTAAKDSYKVLSMRERGLAGKLMDFNLSKNPLAAPYSRAQSILRYEKNPFFRLQENIETRVGLAALGGKNVRPRSGAYDETIQKISGKNGIFTSGYGAEGADSFSGSFSGVGAKISRDQKANIAASIEKFAGGPDKVDAWLINPKNADLLNDIKTVVQYPDKGFTSSNLSKMMNLVSFPSRYNLKVTGFAVRQLAKAPAMTQIATIRALGDFNEFVNSPEGTRWQADNKEAIGLIKYFTPIMPIASVYETLTGKNKSLMDTGMVGGLPFGLITRALQGQGALKDRVPYVDPKTGKVYSDRIPEDLKARAESLLNSVVDTLYTYPGRTAGLDSKKQLTSGLVENATFGKLKDGKYSEVDRSKDVTPAQQRQIDVLKSLPQGGGIKSLGTPALPTVKRPTSIKPAPIYKAKKAGKGKKAKAPSIPIGRL